MPKLDPAHTAVIGKLLMKDPSIRHLLLKNRGEVNQPDANSFAEQIEKAKNKKPEPFVQILTPDLDDKPDMLKHNFTIKPSSANTSVVRLFLSDSKEKSKKKKSLDQRFAEMGKTSPEFKIQVDQALQVHKESNLSQLIMYRAAANERLAHLRAISDNKNLDAETALEICIIDIERLIKIKKESIDPSLQFVDSQTGIPISPYSELHFILADNYTQTHKQRK